MIDIKIYNDVLSYAKHLETELRQSEEEGKDVKPYIERVKHIVDMPDDDPQKELKAAEIYDEIASQPAREGYVYVEPSSLEEIKSVRPRLEKSLIKNKNLTDEVLFDKIYGAWSGRCAGCLAGIPIEGWHKDRLLGLLKETDNYPFRFYISGDVGEELIKKYDICQDKRMPWINNINNYIKSMPGDDDTNYTVFGLKLLETFGRDFTPIDVANLWQAVFPVHEVCTAEKVAYKNFVNGMSPPKSANFRNPYREWIGAQIRSDFFGYINPGNPELAAEMAWRDASISHVKNGIYGEMLFAAMLAAAAVTNDMNEIIRSGLTQIPEKSRLAEVVYWVLGLKEKGLSWEQAIEEIHLRYDEKSEHDWCHTISNASIVCLSLIYGDSDFEKTISIAIMSAFDTDCNSATAGSIVGMIIGAKAIPEKWIKPLNNILNSCIRDYTRLEISELASRTVKVIKKAGTISNSTENLF